MTLTSYVSAHGRAQVAQAMFATLICIIVGEILIAFIGLVVSPNALDGLVYGQEDLSLLLGVFGLLALARIAVFILTVIAFLVWLHRAYSNLQPLGAMGLEYTPGFAVGGWFIPFANLYVPYKAVKELWQESNPVIAEPTEDWQKSGAPGWLAVWWVFWIIGNILSRVSSGLVDNAKSSGDLALGLKVSLVVDFIIVLAAILALLVVRGIDKRQEAKSIGVINFNTPPPPPIFT